MRGRVTVWVDDEGRLRLGWRIALAILVSLLANVVAIDIAEAFAGGNIRLVDAIYRPLLALILLVTYSFLLISADRVHDGALAAMGLGLRAGWLRELAVGAALGAGMICVAVLVIMAGGHVTFAARFNVHVAGLIVLELFVLFTGAIAEELMFRGYPFQRLVDGLGPSGAIVLVSFLFGLAHIGNPHSSIWALINTVAVGVLLSVAYLRTRRLWLPWGIHFAWNTVLGMIFGLPVSGLTDFSVLVHGRAQGPAWLTGGAYGLEGSATGTAVILLGFIPLMLATCAHPARLEPQEASR